MKPVSILTRPEGRVLQSKLDYSRDHHKVSILTRPEGRVLLAILLVVGIFYLVSILTRPEGRVLLVTLKSMASGAKMFQSSPAPKDGCYKMRDRFNLFGKCFNPHPPRRTGAT